METTNFKLVDEIYLRHAGVDYDLHNEYSFEDVSYSVTRRAATLTWTREQQSKSLVTRLNIEFGGVHFFKYYPRDAEVPFSEDDCLDAFGFSDGVIDPLVGPDFHDDEECSLHRRFDFLSGAKIIIGASHATLSIVY